MTYDFAVWWTVVGRWIAPTILIAALGAAVSRFVARRLVPIRDPERPARRLARDLAALSFAALVSVAVVAASFASMKVVHGHVTIFMFPAAVAFYLCGLLLPGWAAVTSLARRDFLRLGVAAVPIAIALLMLFVEPNRLEIRRATISIPTLPPKTVIRVAHLSDIQTVMFGAREEAAARAVAEFDPDFVVFTGDLLASTPDPVLVAQARAYLSGLRSKTTRFAVNGDSDADFDVLMKDLDGVTYLKDDGVDLTVNGALLRIGGVDNKRRPPDPQRALAESPEGATRILLCHNPDYFLSSGEWRAEIGFAGHTHGGQVRVPGLGALVTFTSLGARYASGVFEGDALDSRFPWHVGRMVVCGGLGMEGSFAPRVRLLCPPEIWLVTLTGPPGG